MSRRVLIVGDSHAQGSPGLNAERALRASGLETRRVAHVGRGPIDYTRDGALWGEYTSALRTFRPDIVAFLWGSNDFGAQLQPAFERLRDAALDAGAVPLSSGPPHYPRPEREEIGAGIREANRAVFGARFVDAWPHTPLSLPRDRMGEHLPGESGRPWGEAVAAAVVAVDAGGSALDAAKGSTPRASTWLAVGLVAAGALGLAWWLRRR